MNQRRLNCIGIAAALGCTAHVIYGVKKANRLLHEQGREELIFTGRLSTPRKVNQWMDAHPEFVASRVLTPHRHSPGRRKAGAQ